MPKLGAPLDFSQLEARNVAVHNLSAAPGSPVKGQMYYDTITNTLLWWDGTAWQSAKGGGTPPDATTSSKGVVQLAGDLTGTAAAPTIATGAVTSAKIADGTITDVDVAAANKDGTTAVPSMRTLGLGAQQAMPGNERLDQITAPTAPVSLNGQRITNLGDPTGAQDGATKNYVDATAQGLDAKQSVKAASTGNLTLSGTQTVDGVALVAGDRVLCKDQTTAANNGIYVVAAGAWTRSADADTWTELPSAYAFVEQGTVNADTGWTCTADQGGTLGTTPVPWTQFSSSGTITAGAGLTKAGNTISVLPDNLTIDTAGSGSSVEVKAGGIGGTQLAAGAVDLTTKVTGTLPIAGGGTGQTTAKAARETGLLAAGYYSNGALHGAGTTITITQATHGLRSSRAVHVQVQDNTTGNAEIPDVSVAANGDVTITYAASVSANSKLVTLVG
jgi:hypothetical protein